MGHHSTLTVRWSELDPYQHVNHAVYLTYLESARIEALNAIGWGMGHLAGAGIQIVVVELDIRFLRSAVAGDVLDVHTSVASMGRASTNWTQVITRDGERVVDASVRVAVTDLAGRPRRIPADLAASLTALGS